MNRPPLKRPAMKTALVSLTSVALLALLSTQAQAGCSHLVTSTGEEHFNSTVFAMRLSALAASGELATTGQPPWSPRNDWPCSGPGCSNRSFPSEAPVSPNVNLDQDWCLGLLSPELSQRETAPLSHGQRNLSPIHISTSIERPPRGLCRSPSTAEVPPPQAVCD